jgi:hypothetical protein
MKQSSTPTASELIKQLIIVFQSQKAYLLSEHAFEDMEPWERLIMEWDTLNEKLHTTQQRTKLSDAERNSIVQLIDDHHQLCLYGKAQLLKMGEQMHLLQSTIKARKSYEFNDNESIFYDKKK